MVYGHYKCFNSFSAGIVFSHQNLTTKDVRFWRLKTVPAQKGLNTKTSLRITFYILRRFSRTLCINDPWQGTRNIDGLTSGSSYSVELCFKLTLKWHTAPSPAHSHIREVQFFSVSGAPTWTTHMLAIDWLRLPPSPFSTAACHCTTTMATANQELEKATAAAKPEARERETETTTKTAARAATEVSSTAAARTRLTATTPTAITTTSQLSTATSTPMQQHQQQQQQQQQQRRRITSNL